MAQVALNFLVYENKPTLNSICTVNILPSETIDNLREKICEQWKTTVNTWTLTLFTPKTPLSTANEEEFNKALYELNLGLPGEPVALNKLNPTRTVANSGFSEPAEEVLHIIVFPPPAGGADGKKFKPLAIGMKDIYDVLEKYSPRLQELVAKAGQKLSLLPTWIPKTRGDTPVERNLRAHVTKLDIPGLLGKPNLLFHDLGDAETVIDKDHVADIFPLYNHIVLINTSGSGKTRLGLRGLCQNWGFYAVVKPGSDGIGSDDFWALMDGLDNSRDYKEAERRILQFLLARFLLLQLLVFEAKNFGGDLANYRLLWVLLQSLPGEMLGFDAFQEVADALGIFSIKDLQAQIKERHSELSHILESVVDSTTGQLTRRPFYCFLDEIQVTTTDRMGQYSRRPLLRPIWSTLTGVLESTEMLLILSGTAIDVKSLEDVLNYGIFKPYPYKVVRDIGAFEDGDAQKRYIEHYLLDQNSAAWRAFLGRAWGWCRGRYRSTATLIQLMLACGPHSPHSVLDEFVNKSTGFKPTDGQQFCVHEPQFDNLETLQLWNFEIFEKRKLNVLCDVLYHQMLYGHYVLSPFAPEDDIKAFIRYGVARTRSGESVIDEPLVIMAAWNWLQKDCCFSLLYRLQHGIGNHAPRKNVFEAYLAFYVRKALEQPAKLDDVFAFRTDFACRKDGDLSWQSEEFELVTVSVSANSNKREISVVTPSCGPSSNIGLLACTNEDILEWISTNKECYAFCFPTDFTGPDIFFVRSKATQQLLLVAMQAKNYEQVEAATLIQGVRTVTPSWFWKSKNIKYQSSNDAPILSPGTASSFFDALNKIEPRITIKDVPFPVLRVFASWPADADIERTLNVVDKMPPKKKKRKTYEAEVDEENVKTHDPDLHPLATLHWENFIKNSETFAQSWYKGDVEQQVIFATRNPDKVQRRMFQ